GRTHGLVLLRLAPNATQHQCVVRPACSQLLKEPTPFVGEHNMAILAYRRLSYVKRASVRVEVFDAQPSDLLIAGAGQQKGMHKQPEVSIAGVKQPLCLGDAEATDTGGPDPFERGDTLPRPR